MPMWKFVGRFTAFTLTKSPPPMDTKEDGKQVTNEEIERLSSDTAQILWLQLPAMVQAFGGWPHDAVQGTLADFARSIIAQVSEAKRAIDTTLLNALLKIEAEGPLFAWANEKGIGEEEWKRRSAVVDSMLEAIARASR